MSKAPVWMANPTTQPVEYITISDVISVDTTSSTFTATNSVSMQLGVSQYGEPTGVTAQLFSPFGIYSMPLPGTIGKPGSQVLSWVRNDEYYSLAGRDVTNQYKAGTVNPGEIAMYAPGAPDVNRVYMDINGNCFIQSISQTNLQVINGQQITITNSSVQLGSSPIDYVALASKVDTIMTLLKTLAIALGAVTTSTVTSLNAPGMALANGIIPTGSLTVQVQQ